MRIQFLGTGGFHPNERRHTACILLPDVGVLLDAGTASFRVSERLETDELDIFLSHTHLDHVFGLSALLVPLMNRQVKRITIRSSPHFLEAVRTLLFSNPLFPVMPAFEFAPLADSVPVPGQGVVTHCPLNHPGGSLGYRLDWPGRSLAYITDTVADRTYLDFIRGVDVLIHECYFGDEHAAWATTTGHSVTSDVAHIARDADVGRLLLVHVDPQRPDDDPIGLDVARAIFPATELVEDRQEVEF